MDSNNHIVSYIVPGNTYIFLDMVPEYYIKLLQRRHKPVRGWFEKLKKAIKSDALPNTQLPKKETRVPLSCGY